MSLSSLKYTLNPLSLNWRIYGLVFLQCLVVGIIVANLINVLRPFESWFPFESWMPFIKPLLPEIGENHEIALTVGMGLVIFALQMLSKAREELLRKRSVAAMFCANIAGLLGILCDVRFIEKLEGYRNGRFVKPLRLHRHEVAYFTVFESNAASIGLLNWRSARAVSYFYIYMTAARDLSCQLEERLVDADLDDAAKQLLRKMTSELEKSLSHGVEAVECLEYLIGKRLIEPGRERELRHMRERLSHLVEHPVLHGTPEPEENLPTPSKIRHRETMAIG